MLSEALRYPLRGEESAKTLLVGGALVLLGALLLLPLLPVLGYLVRAARRPESPPTFDDWAALTLDGFRALLVQVGYVLPVALVGLFVPAVIGAFVVGLGSATRATGGAARAGSVDLVLGLLALGVLLALLLLPIYLLPGGIVLFAREDRIGAAFDATALKRLLFSTDYLVGWVIATLVFGIGGIASTLLAVVLVGFVLQFYVSVVGYRILGEAVDRALADPPDLGA